MCTNCGFSPCNCSPAYSFNWYNTTGYPCDPCTTTTVCKKKIPAKCTIYNGGVLDNLTAEAGDSIQDIIITINSLLGSLNVADLDQQVTNAVILNILNDINTRINTLAGGTPHAPYIL